MRTTYEAHIDRKIVIIFLILIKANNMNCVLIVQKECKE
jgi:hypothetical protein